jgi:hypothetical protein
VELDAISRPALEQIEQIGGADVVVGLLDATYAEEPRAAVAMTREALAGLSRIVRVMVICNNGTHSPDPATPMVASEGDQAPSIFFCSLPAPGTAETRPQSISRAYRSVLAIGEKLEARACGVIASQPQAITPQSIHRLVQPILELGFDLVAPRYTRHKMEGLLNRSVLSPLHRALYGEQLQNPLGPDFGMSGKLMQRVTLQDAGARGNESNLVASIASTAACCGFQICESHLGARVQPPIDWMNLSSLLAQVLGPVFLDMERQAASWQKIRESKPTPGFGLPETIPDDTGPVDVQKMIESFQLGAENLEDIWGVVLPPTSLLELRKLARLPPNQFRMPDELWVRTVYDFALGHKVRSISRDHLLRSITPLYLGWIASYALELEAAGPAEVEPRIERLSTVFEASKSYLVSRWRWPDRFNP